MAGIYIHIPFCKQACHYCNFHFSTSLALKEDMIQALIHETEIRSRAESRYVAVIGHGEPIKTIYFGGGTPSLLNKTDLERILQAIRSNYQISEDAEITLEANPDDITLLRASEWKKGHINRLSIGIQSFFDHDLIWMNRAHNGIQAWQSVNLAREAGITNISIDLIFGVPGLTNDQWKKNIQKVISLDIPHVACYALTVEPRTALDKMIKLKKKEDIDQDIQAEQYTILVEMMVAAGYEHYEISNFARPGFRSIHNSSYWKGEKYIGIGPSAHSFDGSSRMWNAANNSVYISSLKNRIIPFERELLTPDQQLEEYIMIALRTSEGLDLQWVEDHFSLQNRNRLESLIVEEVKQGTAIIKDNQAVLTNKGKLLADAISIKLFH